MTAKIAPERIHLLLAKVELGPFSEKQVREALAEGLLLPSDLARCKGLEDWTPINRLLTNLPPLPPPLPRQPKDLVEAPKIASGLVNPFLWKPPGILHKPLFKIATRLNDVAPDIGVPPARLLHKPLFEIASNLNGVIAETPPPAKVLHKPLFKIAQSVKGKVSATVRPAEIFYKPAFEIAKPIAGIPATVEMPLAKVLHKPLFKIAQSVKGKVSATVRPAEIFYKPVFEIAKPIVLWEIQGDLPPAEVIYKPLFETAKMIVDLPVIVELAPIALLHKPLFEIAPAAAESRSVVELPPAHVVHQPLFELANAVAPAFAEIEIEPARVLIRPLFEIAAPINPPVLPARHLPAEVWHKPLFEIATPVGEAISQAAPPSQIFHKPLFELTKAIGEAPTEIARPPDVLHKPLFEMAAGVANPDVEKSSEWQPAEVLFKAQEPVTAPSPKEVESAAWLWMPPAAPSEKARPMETRVTDAPSSPGPVEKNVETWEEEATSKAFARSVREAYQTKGMRTRDMPVNARLLAAKAQASMRSRRSVFSRMRDVFESPVLIYSFFIALAVGMVAVIWNWSVLEPIVSSFWIQMNLAIYTFIDDVIRALTTT